MARRNEFTTDGYNEYLGLEEDPVIVGKFHWLVWVTPLLLTVLVGYFQLFHSRNLRVVIGVAIITAIALKSVGPLHKWKFGWILVVVGLAAVAAERYDGFLTWLFGASLAYTAYRWLDHRWTTFILTTGRIVRRSGILTTQTATMNLRALTDIRLEETVLGQLLNYGHFMVESAGQQQAFTDLRFVPAPEYFYQLVMTVALGKMPVRDPARVLPPGWSYG